MDDNKFWFRLLVSLAAIFWAGAIVTCLICKAWDKQYIDAGYSKTTIQGSEMRTWVKSVK